jgi:hypothetical protein
MQHNAIKEKPTGDQRNQLLRRVDWRFLLPDPNPGRVAFSANGMLFRALSLVSGEVVPLGEALPESCDLAVVSHPRTGSLRSAWESLAPGGAFYSEWYSPLSAGPVKIKQQIVRAGFEDLSIYWSWPFPRLGPALFWLPLEAPAALEYFQKTRPPSRSFRQEVVRSFLRMAWRIGRNTRLLVPIGVTARKQPERQAEKHDWLMLTGGHSPSNKVVKYGFKSKERVPSIVVKHARVAESIPTLVREAENLDLLARLPGREASNVPHLLFLERSEKTVAVGESVIDGDPLYTHLKRENYRALALKATAWLVHLANSGKVIPREEWWERIVQPALDGFERKYGRELGSTWNGRIQDCLRPLESMLVMFEHRDFSPWNVLVTTDGQLAILDWESGEPEGLPGMDLIYFLTFLAFFQDGAMKSGNFHSAYQAAQDLSSFTGSVQAECIKIYFEALGLDPGIAWPLRVLAWTIHSLSVFPRINRWAGKKGDEEPGLFLQLLERDIKEGCDAGELPGNGRSPERAARQPVMREYSRMDEGDGG